MPASRLFQMLKAARILKAREAVETAKIQTISICGVERFRDLVNEYSEAIDFETFDGPPQPPIEPQPTSIQDNEVIAQSLIRRFTNMKGMAHG